MVVVMTVLMVNFQHVLCREAESTARATIVLLP
jgi:hypothetical protein